MKLARCAKVSNVRYFSGRHGVIKAASLPRLGKTATPFKQSSKYFSNVLELKLYCGLLFLFAFIFLEDGASTSGKESSIVEKVLQLHILEKHITKKVQKTLPNPGICTGCTFFFYKTANYKPSPPAIIISNDYNR